MSLSSEIFGRNSFIHKLTNVMGLGIPGLLDRNFGTQPPEAQVNSIGDISKQTAKEGDPRVIVWGRVRPIGGNIIHCQEPQKRWILSYGDSGGKGGNSKKQKIYTEHVFRTYAIGICEGPISGITRIWKNGTLVYDARGNAWGAANNHIFLRDAKIYLGGWDQMPCPDLQAIWGDVPAYRGTAYIVFINQDLTQMSGAVPQYQFEVERAEGVYLTSKPYAVENVESGSGDFRAQRLRNPEIQSEANEQLSSNFAAVSLYGYEQMVEYEEIESVAGGVSAQALAVYGPPVIRPSDQLEGGVSAQAMAVRNGLIKYTLNDHAQGAVAAQGLNHESI